MITLSLKNTTFDTNLNDWQVTNFQRFEISGTFYAAGDDNGGSGGADGVLTQDVDIVADGASTTKIDDEKYTLY